MSALTAIAPLPSPLSRPQLEVDTVALAADVRRAGATSGTATLDEAVALRRAGVAVPLLCWLLPVDAAWEAALRDAATRLFRALGCGGLSRFDFFVTDDGFVLNEVNTMPGMTPWSGFPRMARAAGLDLPALTDELVAVALAQPRGVSSTKVASASR